MNPEEKEKKSEYKIGDVIAYTREVDRFVVDEEGNQIPCKSDVEAKTLSLLFEIKELLKKEDKD